MKSKKGIEGRGWKINGNGEGMGEGRVGRKAKVEKEIGKEGVGERRGGDGR